MDDRARAIVALEAAGFGVDDALFPMYYHDKYLQGKFRQAEFAFMAQTLLQTPRAIVSACHLVGAMLYYSTTHEAHTKWSDAIVLTEAGSSTPLLEELVRHGRLLEKHHLDKFYFVNYSLDWEGESFTYEDFTFDISMGLDIVQGRTELGALKVAEWVKNPMFNIEINPAQLPHVDIAKPLLMATLPQIFGGTHLLIDGWHRLHKAHQQGVPTLYAHVLNLHETYMVLRSQPYRPVWQRELRAKAVSV